VNTNDPSPAAERTPLVAVVDDDRMCTMMLDRILTRAGYAVRVFASGEEVLDAAGTTTFDAICVDMSLQGIDGIETISRLKQAGGNTPAILFSASADEVRERALAAGATACVAKSGAWDELRAAIAEAIAARS